MKILVTGSSGFIGSHVCESLHAAGHDIIGLDIQRIIRPIGSPSALNIMSITDSLATKDLFDREKFDAVIHLAAKTGVPGGELDPKGYWDVNVNGFNNIKYLCVKYNVKKLIYASSSSVYGTDNDMAPKSAYAKTKKFNESDAAFLGSQLRTVGLRFFTVYGEWGRPEMSIYKWAKAALNNEPINIFDSKLITSRYYTYVDDICRGIKKVLREPKELGGASVYDVAGPTSIPIVTAARDIFCMTESDSKINLMENLHYDVASCEPSNRLLPLAESTSFIVGLSTFINWAKSGGMAHG